jgi:hypothetical protein
MHVLSAAKEGSQPPRAFAAFRACEWIQKNNAVSSKADFYG